MAKRFWRTRIEQHRLDPRQSLAKAECGFAKTILRPVQLFDLAIHAFQIGLH